MMNAVFLILGLLFDVIILAASGTLIYSVFQPDILDTLNELLGEQFASRDGRIQLLTVGIVFFLLSFRSVFLLLGRGGTPEVLVLDRPTGKLTVTYMSLENVLRRLVETRHDGVALRRSRVRVAPAGGLDIRLRVELDLVDINLNEYSTEIEAVIRDHFKEKLGLEINELNLKAEYAYSYPDEQGA